MNQRLWMRGFKDGAVADSALRVVPRADAAAAVTTIGGLDIAGLMEKARKVELSIYKISSALVPPEVGQLDLAEASSYRPFDVIEAFVISEGTEQLSLRPLVVLDDAHSLHPDQLSGLKRWLARRELKVARWILTRLDSLKPAEVLADALSGDGSRVSGIKKSRDITEIWMQSDADRVNSRKRFRRMARDMARRYLRQMDIFNRRGLRDLSDILATETKPLAPSKLEELSGRVEALRKRLHITLERRDKLSLEVTRYCDAAKIAEPDMRLAILGILLARYANRTPDPDQQQRLFDDPAELDPEPNRKLEADSDVAEGARIYLLHTYGRPYYYGLDRLCDASSENAEQFLQLANRLVTHTETLIIRGKPPALSGDLQDDLLREKSGEMIRDWEFPQHQRVRKLIEFIGVRAKTKSLEENAALGGGACAIGIPQKEFEALITKNAELAMVFKYGVAYNAITILQSQSVKNKIWCLFELGGIALMHYKLTLHRGGFVEIKAADLAAAVLAEAGDA